MRSGARRGRRARAARGPRRGVCRGFLAFVVAYDAGNGGIRAWRLEGDELEPLWWRDDIAHAGHLIVYPDTAELVCGDWHDFRPFRARGVRPVMRALAPLLARSPTARRASSRVNADRLVVLDIETGDEKARVDVPSPMQGFLFPAPGFGRDVYYQSLTTIARVAVA